jgi:WD40 repeat protein
METLELKKVIDLEKMLGHSHSVNTLLWLEDKQLLVSAGDDKKIMVWRLDSTSV